MQFPDSVIIGPKRYAVSFKPSMHNESGGFLEGEIRYQDANIFLNQSSEPQTQRAALIHEIVHGLCEYMNVDMKEADVIRLGNALTVFLKENAPEMQELFPEGFIGNVE